MGGQACVFYGAAQFSKDIDLVLFASEENFERLRAALAELNARRIAVPRFDPAILDRGHAVHYRCQSGDADGLRVDIMTRLRDLADFETLWNRRTTIADESGGSFDLMSIEDLIQAKKTQRGKDWPVINALVEGHYQSFRDDPTPARIDFWIHEARTPERLFELVRRFPAEVGKEAEHRPLLRLAMNKDLEGLRAALDAEVREEQAKDRLYWAPLKAEMEAFRREELRQRSEGGI
jgi:hypothetical protein